MRAFKQGDLDGFCGIYSIVHAYLFLLEESFPNHGRDLFRNVCKFIPQREMVNYLCDGINIDELLKIAKKTSNDFKKHGGIKITASTPFAGRNFKDRNEFFDELAMMWEQRYCCFIVGIEWPITEGGGGHWTVLKYIKDDALGLIDSGGKQKLPLKRVGVSGRRGTRLVPRETLKLTLESVNGEQLRP